MKEDIKKKHGKDIKHILNHNLEIAKVIAGIKRHGDTTTTTTTYVTKKSSKDTNSFINKKSAYMSNPYSDSKASPVKSKLKIRS